jgi:hypothetical protein
MGAQLWEAYMLNASAEGAGAGSLSVAMDHLRAVASQWSKDTSPRDWLLTASMLAETSACMGEYQPYFKLNISGVRDVGDCWHGLPSQVGGRSPWRISAPFSTLLECW